MKKTLLLASLLPTVLFAQKAQHPCAASKIHSGTQEKSNTFTVAQIAETERYDVHYYFLDLNMTNTATTLSGSAEMHAHARESLDSALMEFYPSFNISSITVDGAPVMYSRVNTALKIPVNKNTGENFVIKVTYDGTPPTAASNPLGGGGMTHASSPSWGNQATWSLSESFVAYEWFPVKQSLKDKADSSAVWITVPNACKAGSNGLLQQVVDLGNGTHRFEWKNNHMIDYYLISVAVAQYVEYNVTANPVGSGPVLVQNYIYDNPQCLPHFQADIDATADFIELYAQLYGPYPFADQKYGHCMAPISGGMEHQTMTTQGYFGLGLTDHELGHQWFGDHVTCNSWAEIWVNEGFASYSEHLTLEYLHPGDEVQNMQHRHSNIMSQAGGSVWVEDSLHDASIFDSRLVYDKGAAIIHTLRFLINDDTLFFNALKQYQILYADSTASGLDFIQVVEDVTGMDFSAFMNEWYFGEGYVKYGVRWNIVGNDLFVEINEQQSMPSATPLFTNDLELKFDRTTLADTIIRFPITGLQNQFVIPNGADYANVLSIDPNNWIINSSLGITHDPNFTVGLNELTAVDEITISPNPAVGPVTVHMNKTGSYELVVVDSRGKVVLQQDFNDSTSFDLGNNASGMYMIQVKGQNSDLIVRKVVKR